MTEDLERLSGGALMPQLGFGTFLSKPNEASAVALSTVSTKPIQRAMRR